MSSKKPWGVLNVSPKHRERFEDVRCNRHAWYVAKVQAGILAAEEGRFAAKEDIDAVFSEFGA